MREAADVLRPVRDRVVVIGAVALEAALFGSDASSAATTDVDCAVDMASAPDVIAHLEATGLKPSDQAHERGFTWQRDGLKVQLIRPPARVASPPASRLPANMQFSVAGTYREDIAFEGSPEEPRLVVARAAAVLALKGHAFGRTRANGALVERDYHDAYLLIAHVGDEIASEFNATNDGQLKSLIRGTLRDLQQPAARRAAGSQMTQLEQGLSAREADLRLQRGVTSLERRLR